MGSVAKTHKQADRFHVTGLRGLSKAAATFLERRPKEARMAVAVALETAAAHYEARSGRAANDTPDSLKPFIVHRPPGEDLINVSEAAERLRVSRTTVYDWVKRKTLLGWKSTKRGLTIPAEQILGPGKVMPGIAQVLDIIDDPELAWVFLSEEWPFAAKAARPIDLLKAGDIEEVENAAPSFGTAFT